MTNEYIDDNLKKIYDKKTQDEIIELNKMVTALKTKVISLTELLEGERAMSESIPLPHSVIYQVVELTRDIDYKQRIIDFYESEIDESVIINRKNMIRPPRKSAFKKN